MKLVLRRRAVVAGRAVDRAGTPCRGPAALSLSRPAPPQRFCCHLRSDGRFYFVDVPPGRYTLDHALARHGSDGEWAQPGRDVVVPSWPAGTVRPVVDIGVEIVDPAGLSWRPRPT